MFMCDECRTTTGPGQKMQRLFSFRPATYPPRQEAHRFRWQRKHETRDDPGGTGWNIETEYKLCRKCYKRILEER